MDYNSVPSNQTQFTQPIAPANEIQRGPPSGDININDSSHKNSKIKIILFTIPILILIVGIGVGTYLTQQKQTIKSEASEEIVAQVNGDKITISEFNQTKHFFANLSNKPENDPEVGKQALKFVIEHRLLKKYVADKGILDQINQVANTRFEYITQNAAIATDQATLSLTTQDKNIYNKYVLDQAIREQLKQSAIKWKDIHFLSIRYHFDDNDMDKEKSYKLTVERKIKEYQAMIKDEESLKEAIKKRCQDKDINYLPYEISNKVYTASFNGTICREQAVNLKISTSTNPMFGSNWLKKVFESTKKGEISPIIDYTDTNLGMYFIVYEIDEGGESISLDELINTLKASNNIQIYKYQ